MGFRRGPAGVEYGTLLPPSFMDLLRRNRRERLRKERAERRRRLSRRIYDQEVDDR